MKAAIECHSLAWKRLETEPSPDSAEELHQAEAAMARAASGMEPVSEAIDEVLGELGIDPDLLEDPLPIQKNRLWQIDLEPGTVPKDEVDIETALERGLARLLEYFPDSWVKRQLERGELLMRVRGVDPPFLLGDISAEPMLQRERFGYGLTLSMALLEGDPHFDMYEAPTLVPQIATLCESLSQLQKVERGVDKLKELRRAPAGEVDSRIYELLVAARAAEMGRTLSFILTDPRSPTPDLRVHDMHFPVVMECKLQSRRSEVETHAVNLMREIRGWFRQEKQKDSSIIGDLRLRFMKPIAGIRAEEVCKDLLDLWSSLNPFREKQFAWGHAEWRHLATETTLPTRLKAFCPLYVEQLISADSKEEGWDGLFLLVKDQFGPFADDVKMPLCVRWRLESVEDQSALARNVVRLLSEAIQQIPVGEAGILYIGYVDSLRASIADRRTEVIIDALPEFGHTKRGIIAPMVEINRLYPHVLDHGLPDLIESAIPATQDRERALHRYFPTLVFTRGDGADTPA
ncbi:MAG TPA: hypothetical protein VGI45_28855 [Terracidiphilus sp.]